MVPAFHVSTGRASPSPLIHMFRGPVPMPKMSRLLHFYHHKHAKPDVEPRAKIGMSPVHQGVRKRAHMLSLEKRPKSKPTQPHHKARPRLTLVKTPRSPHPRLIDLARILARQAANEAFVAASLDAPIH